MVAFVARFPFIAFVALNSGNSLVAFVARFPLIAFLSLLSLGTSSPLLSLFPFLPFLTGVALVPFFAFELFLHIVGKVNGDVGVTSFDDNMNAGSRHQSKRALVADAKASPTCV